MSPREYEHIVELSATETQALRRWLQEPNGSHGFGRVTFESVVGGGIWVRTRPWTSGDGQAEKARRQTHPEKGRGRPMDLPLGLCSDRADHDPHQVEAGSLAPYWCTADQSTREPAASQRRQDKRTRDAIQDQFEGQMVIEEVMKMKTGDLIALILEAIRADGRVESADLIEGESGVIGVTDVNGEYYFVSVDHG